MLTLFHHPFCPHSRFVRLLLSEYGLDADLVEERVWERREAFLVLNPAGQTPVLVVDGYPPIPGASVIAEFLDEMHGSLEDGVTQRNLIGEGPKERIEARRLVSWLFVRNGIFP